MRVDWYRMPGPAAFVSQIADDLRAGKSVTIRVTDSTPKGFSKAVRAFLAQDSLTWHELADEAKDAATRDLLESILPVPLVDYGLNYI